MKGWIVARTQHNREAWAAENVLRQFAEPYLPRYAERTKVGGHYELRPKLLFPSYIFVHALDGHWRFLLGTYGVSSVLMVGAAPAIVQDIEILKLRKLEDADGLVCLPKLAPEARFKRGDAVRVNDGAYAGYHGVYDGQGVRDRERILLEYLGRKTPVLIDVTQLSPV